MPPDAKIFGDLETSIHFGLSALSGKERAISKRISRTLTFLEISLETCSRVHDLDSDSGLGRARKEFPRAAASPAAWQPEAT